MKAFSVLLNRNHDNELYWRVRLNFFSPEHLFRYLSYLMSLEWSLGTHSPVSRWASERASFGIKRLGSAGVNTSKILLALYSSDYYYYYYYYYYYFCFIAGFWPLSPNVNELEITWTELFTRTRRRSKTNWLYSASNRLHWRLLAQPVS